MEVRQIAPFPHGKSHRSDGRMTANHPALYRYSSYFIYPSDSHSPPTVDIGLTVIGSLPVRSAVLPLPWLWWSSPAATWWRFRLIIWRRHDDRIS